MYAEAAAGILTAVQNLLFYTHIKVFSEKEKCNLKKCNPSTELKWR